MPDRRSPPWRRDQTVIMITAIASITKNVSVLPAALGIHGAITRMLAAMAAKMPTIHADGAGRDVLPVAGREGRRCVTSMPAMIKISSSSMLRPSTMRWSTFARRSR